MNRRRTIAVASARRTAREARDVSLALLAVLFYLVTRVVPMRSVIVGVGFLASRLGSRLPHYRQIGARNLALAFPEKTKAERRAILRDSWDNMGRTAAEYFFIDQIWDFDPAAPDASRIEVRGGERFAELATDDKPAIILSAHLANWELPMVAAARHGLEASALYRRPANRWIARMLVARRRSVMGELVESEPGALHRLARSLGAGRHVGLLVDQYFEKGPQIQMFGHETRANPIFARLARQIDCPVHAVRVVRLPDDRFRVELTDALELPRDAAGRVDIAGAAQAAANIIEGWVRENPGQWLWVHRRWR
jgi:KDO2-lipid IV(A) lauroyltransferase